MRHYTGMNVLIAGAGAMGSLFAALLAKAGNQVALIEKKCSRARSISKKGLVVRGLSRFVLEPYFFTVNAPPSKLKAGQFNAALLFVKSYDTFSAVKAIIPYLSENTLILTLQNGLGNADSIRSALGAEYPAFKKNIFAGTTSHGATTLDDNTIKHTGKGDTVFGPVCMQRDISCKLEIFRKLFKNSGIAIKTCTLPYETGQILWSKVVVNSAVNALAAATGLRNGGLMRTEELKKLVFAVAVESADAAKKNGIKLSYADPEKMAEDVCRKTSSNVNSMLADINNNRITEIESINGAILKEAKKAGMEVPLNSVLFNMIKYLEKSI